LRRLGTRHLDVGRVTDENGVLRLVFPTPTWEEFLWCYLAPGRTPVAHRALRS
jgi:hypothetical protein